MMNILALVAAVLMGIVAAYIPMIVLAIAGGILALLLVIWLLDKPLPLIATILGVIVFGQLGRIPPLSGEIVVIDLLVGLLFVGWIMRMLWIKERPVMTSFHMVWLAFLAITLIGLVGTPLLLDTGELARNGLYWVRLVMYSSVVWIIPSIITTKEQGVAVLRWIATTGLILAVIGFIQLALYPDIGPLAKYGWDPHVGRLVSSFVDPNYLGGFFAIALAVYLVRGLGAYGKFPWIEVALLLVATMATFSRSGYLAVGVVVLAFGLRYSWKLLIIALCCIIPLALAVPRVRERVAGGFSIDATSQARIESWERALQVIGAFPFLGVGYNNYRDAQLELRILEGGKDSRAASGSDSSLLNVQATTGFVGAGVFLAALILIGRRAQQYLRKTASVNQHAALALILVGPAIFVHSFFVNSLFYPFIFFPLMLLVALLFVDVGGEE